MTYEIERAISVGLTPRKLEHLIREHASVEKIAFAYMIEHAVVRMLMARWGLSHLSGRAKANVVLVREAVR